jgi:hypothetical protein
MMVALRSTDIELVALSDAVSQLRTVPVEGVRALPSAVRLSRPASGELV